MSVIHLEVRIKPRPGLLNPEGKAIHSALNSLGWKGVADARVGRVIYLELESPDEATARETAEAMCRKLLANPVTEDYEVVVSGAAEGATP